MLTLFKHHFHSEDLIVAPKLKRGVVIEIFALQEF